MSATNTALQTLASRIFATAKGHAYDEGGSAAAIATILENEGLTPAVLAAQAVAQNTANTAQAAAADATSQLAAAHEVIKQSAAAIADHQVTIAAQKEMIAEHQAAIADRDHRIAAMKTAAAIIAAA